MEANTSVVLEPTPFHLGGELGPEATQWARSLRMLAQFPEST